MLTDRQFIGFVHVTDGARARAFYEGVLGLRAAYEDSFAVVFDAGGTQLRLTIVPEVPEPLGTDAGWLVDDIVATARELFAAGVILETFPGLDQDEDGVWEAPGGDRIAWFRDPDGNRLSLTQPAPA
ncbi:MAG: hypothetical protein QOI47_297 [Actinomycetota bacterium]|nr:hypothetical protein [Actinomycetota bacterium]